MPLHDWKCRLCGRIEERFVSVAALKELQKHHCFGDPLAYGIMEVTYLRAPLSFVREDVRYESPVSGRPITTYQQHVEELARTDCVVYESGIKQDQDRNARMRDEELERSVDETVDREIATMPALKKEKLVAELEGGLTATPERLTPSSRKILTELVK